MFLLACVAAVATAMPAKATLVFELWRPNEQSDITLPSSATAANFAANYTPITAPISLVPGQEMIVTAVLHQTDTNGADTFANVGTGATTQRLIGYGFGFRYLPGVAVHKPPVDVFSGDGTMDNTSGLAASGFSGTPNVFTNVAGASIPRDLTLSAGYFAASNFYTLASFRIQGVANGSGNLQFFDPSNSDDIGSAVTPGMDTLIYSHAPGGVYNFPIVVGVPEPSSMILVGVAVAGLGYRARRKKMAAVVA